MAKTLDYERASYTELRRPPRWLLPIILILIAGEVLVMLLEWHLANFAAAGVVAICLTILPLGLIAHRLTNSETRVFADRLQLDVFIASFRIRSRRVPWSEISRSDIIRGERFHVNSGTSSVMWNGTGVSFKLREFRELLVGSDDPEALVAAVEVARKAATEKDDGR